MQCNVGADWYVFPLAQGSKRPLFPGVSWHDLATTDPDQIRHWQAEHDCNLGLDCGKSGLFVLDIDGAEGEEELLLLALEHGALPDTREHSTPRGGRHLIFRGQGRSLTGIRPKIDSRSQGGYIVIPPGRVNGNPTPYSVAKDLPIVDAPQWLLALTAQRTDILVDVPEVDLDTPQATAHAAAYLSHAPPAVEGAGGNSQTYKVACTVRDLGLSQAYCLTQMLEVYNPKCQPPWDNEEIERLVANAYQYAQSSAPGAQSSALKAQQAKDVFPSAPLPATAAVGPFAAPAPETLATIGADSMYQVTPEPQKWLVPGLIPEQAITLFTGRPGTGKSYLGLQLALGTVTGKWLDWPCLQIPSLYLGCEDPENVLRLRVHALQHGAKEYKSVAWPNAARCAFVSRLGRPNHIGIVKDGRGILPGPLFHILVQYYDALPLASRLLVLDTAADTYAGDENNRSMVNAFAKELLGYLTTRYSLTIVLIAHPPKRGEGTQAEFSGSTAWEASVRSRLNLAHHNPDNPDEYRVLKCSKSNYAGIGGEEILLREPCGTLLRQARSDVLGVIDSYVYNAISAAVDSGQALLPNKRGGEHRWICAPGTVLDAAGRPLSETAIKEALSRLLKAGSVEERKGQSERNGLYPA